MVKPENMEARADLGVKVVVNDTLQIGDVSVAFQRTLRMPKGFNPSYPPDLGSFPIRRVSDYGDKAPASWREHGGVFAPLLQREAVWLKFTGRDWRPSAIKVAAGKLCAVTGKPWSEAAVLHQDPQDYLVLPSRQPWLDGINFGKDNIISQFITSPLGSSAQEYERHVNLLQLLVFQPKPGFFPELPPRDPRSGRGCGGAPARDRGLELWDQTQFATVVVHLCNSEVWKEITGQAMPESLVSEETYSSHGLPWWTLYEERALVPKPEPEPEVRVPEPEMPEPEPEPVRVRVRVRVPEPEVRVPEPEVRGPEPEMRGPEPEVRMRGPEPEVHLPEQEVRVPKPEPEVRVPKAEPEPEPEMGPPPPPELPEDCSLAALWSFCGTLECCPPAKRRRRAVICSGDGDGDVVKLELKGKPYILMPNGSAWVPPLDLGGRRVTVGFAIRVLHVYKHGLTTLFGKTGGAFRSYVDSRKKSITVGFYYRADNWSTEYREFTVDYVGFPVGEWFNFCWVFDRDDCTLALYRNNKIVNSRGWGFAKLDLRPDPSPLTPYKLLGSASVDLRDLRVYIRA